MKLFYEFRCSRDGKCAHTEYLDYLVASLCHVPYDRKLYTVPAGNSVNWLSVVVSALCAMGSQKLSEMKSIGMDEILEAVENGTTGKVIDFKKPFEEIFKMFKRMDMFVYVQLIADDDDTEKYKTKEPEKWFTLDELIKLKWGTTPVAKLEPAWWPDQCYSYSELMEDEKVRGQYSIYSRGDHMLVFSNKDWGVKEMYLVNTETRKAFHLVDNEGNVRAFTHDDIDSSVFEAEHTHNAYVLQVCYAKMYVGDFVNGRARVEWMLYPDGMYFADEDGYGMEDNDEVNIAAVIDEDCKVVEKFNLIHD